MDNKGEVALSFNYGKEEGLSLSGFCLPKQKEFMEKEIRNVYLAEAINYSNVPKSAKERINNFLLQVHDSSVNEKKRRVFMQAKSINPLL